MDGRPRARHTVRVTSADPDPPLRQLTRLRTEMAIASAQLNAALFAGDPMIAIEFAVVARVCLPDWMRDGTLARPAAAVQAISVRQIAFSLGGSPETTRRRVNTLRDRGALIASATGVSLAVTAENEELVRRYYLGSHDLLIRLLEDMATTCDLDLPIAGQPHFGIDDVIRRALDMLLLPIDRYRQTGQSHAAFWLWAALTAAAVRAVTYDPVLSRRYANCIPPDAIRAGVSLRRIAAAIFMPYATAWRQVQVLEDNGLVTRLDDGRWTVLTSNLLERSVKEIATMPSIFLLGRVRELALLGLDPARAEGLYQLGRPPLIDLGRSAAE